MKAILLTGRLLSWEQKHAGQHANTLLDDESRRSWCCVAIDFPFLPL